MKITKKQLQRIIREELQQVINEERPEYQHSYGRGRSLGGSPWDPAVGIRPPSGPRRMHQAGQQAEPGESIATDVAADLRGQREAGPIDPGMGGTQQRLPITPGDLPPTEREVFAQHPGAESVGDLPLTARTQIQQLRQVRESLINDITESVLAKLIKK